MATTLLTPLSIQVPLVDPVTGCPTPYFQRLLQQLLKEKAITDELAEGAVQTSRQIISGGGLTGGGDLSTDRTLAVGAGTGITVNADDVAIDSTYLDERIRDIIGTALVAGANVTITVDDTANTITLAASGGGGGGETILSNQTVSAVSSVVFDSSMITSTYKLYRFRFYDALNSATGQRLLIQGSPDNGSTWRTTGYNSTCTIWQLNGTFSTKFTVTTGIIACGEIHTDTTYPATGETVITNPFSSGTKTLAQGRALAKASDTHRYDWLMAGEYSTTESHNALRVIMSGGATLTGTFILYGMV
jgi:hypothetical protein